MIQANNLWSTNASTVSLIFNVHCSVGGGCRIYFEYLGQSTCSKISFIRMKQDFLQRIVYDCCPILLLLLKILEETSTTTFCKKQLNEEDYQAFAYAIQNKYWYQMYIGKKFHLMIWPYLYDIVSIKEEQEI